MLTTLALLLALVCVVTAGAKLTGQPRMRASAAHFGIAWQRYRLIGVAELAAAAGVLAGLAWPPIGSIAGMALAVLLLGAVLTHARASDSAREMAPALVVLAIDALFLAVVLTG
jgi:DoxX-like family